MLTGRRIAWGRGFLFALGGLLFLLIFLFVLSLSLPGEAILSMVRPHLAKAGMNLSAEEVRFAFPVSVRMRNADLLLPQGESIRLDSVDASFEPLGLFRGINRPIPTVARSGVVIYGRTDMPDDFAYTLAKAMDEQQDLLQWTHMNFSYNWRMVWKAFDIPLHPGAARYYRERGYMK